MWVFVMNYAVVQARYQDVSKLKEYKLKIIFEYANNLSDDESCKIKRYVDDQVSKQFSDYKIILYDQQMIGCFLVYPKDDGVLLDEIYIEYKYRNCGIGTSLIKKILFENDIVYLWVYQQNKKAIALYKKLGFNIIRNTETRYYMQYVK